MKITTDNNEYRTFIEIFPYENSYAHITVMRRIKPLIDEPKAKLPKINWSAIGEVGIENAKLFAAGLNEAIKIAEELENESKNS
jgi:hypothetical protein